MKLKGGKKSGGFKFNIWLIGGFQFLVVNLSRVCVVCVCGNVLVCCSTRTLTSGLIGANYVVDDGKMATRPLQPSSRLAYRFHTATEEKYPLGCIIHHPDRIATDDA
jgi:hypothetical protein